MLNSAAAPVVERNNLRHAASRPWRSSGMRCAASSTAAAAATSAAPTVINVPLGVAVRYVDFSIELQILAYQLMNGTGPLGGGVLHTLGITPPVRRPGS